MNLWILMYYESEPSDKPMNMDYFSMYVILP